VRDERPVEVGDRVARRRKFVGQSMATDREPGVHERHVAVVDEVGVRADRFRPGDL
jgi:hypothetical protein